MNLNSWKGVVARCKDFWQKKVMDHVMEHIIGISLLTGAMLLSCCLGFVALPAMEQCQMLVEQQRGMQQRIAVLNNLAQKDDYAAYEDRLRQKLQAAEGAISRTPDLNNVSQSLVQLAEEQLLQVSALRLPEAESIKRHPQLPVKIYPVKLSVRGDYYALVRFVSKAEKSYCLRGISIAGNKDGNITAELEVLAHGLV